MSHEEINFIDEMEKDDEWLKAHLDEIVARYARRVIAVLDQRRAANGYRTASRQNSAPL
jgi:hypothetical protein